jgi:carbonic anhydrase
MEDTHTTLRPKPWSLFFAAAIAATTVCTAAQTHFTYFGPDGPAFWGELDPEWQACNQGQAQSPIDFGKLTLLTHLQRTPVPLAYERSTGEIVNNGHTIEIETEGHNVLELDGVEYELQQFHFHAPSEHTLEGKGAEMELHLVHKSLTGATAVVGVEVVRGTSSRALAQIFAQLPNDVDVPHHLAAPVNPRNLLPANQDYYRYDGSLTTPPCTEGVHWIVLRNSIAISTEDLAQYHERIHFNARPVQRISR